MRAVLLLALLQRARAACAPRYINAGLPKTGSTSIQDFYICTGLTAGHYTHAGEMLGKQVYKCAARGRKLLDCGPCFDAYAQIDFIGQGRCIIPQITHLERLVRDYGNATFLLPFRNASAWASSAQHFEGPWPADRLPQRLARCQLPGVGAPRNDSLDALAAWYVTVNDRARDVLARAERSRGLKWVEFDVADANAAFVLAGTVPGGGRPACWGQSNANRKHPRASTPGRPTYFLARAGLGTPSRRLPGVRAVWPPRRGVGGVVYIGRQCLDKSAESHVSKAALTELTVYPFL